MGNFHKKSSHTQLQSMRARLRKASCMNDDEYDDAAGPQPEEEPHPQPALIPLPPGEDPSPEPSEAVRDDGTPSEQPQSAFFARLPAEVRRMVYLELFRSANPLMKMHLHAAHDGARLTMTPCRYTPTADFSIAGDERDPMQTDPWPGWRGRNQPPRWFWHAWGLRLRWRVHWKCQAAAMAQWHARGDGTCADLRGQGGAGWMGLFLSCRRMYAEAIECLFEATELIFTASEDAHRFFVQNPHAHTAKIRRLDLAFNHFKDHLFLQAIEPRGHPRLPDGASAAPVGWELWTPLVAALRAGTPELRYLRVHLSPQQSRQGEGLVEALWGWEAQWHGWVTQQEDGVIYYEMRNCSVKEEAEQYRVLIEEAARLTQR